MQKKIQEKKWTTDQARTKLLGATWFMGRTGVNIDLPSPQKMKEL